METAMEWCRHHRLCRGLLRRLMADSEDAARVLTGLLNATNSPLEALQNRTGAVSKREDVTEAASLDSQQYMAFAIASIVVFGVCGNLLSIFLFSRPHMRSSSVSSFLLVQRRQVNVLLCCLGTIDLSLLLFSVPVFVVPGLALWFVPVPFSFRETLKLGDLDAEAPASHGRWLWAKRVSPSARIHKVLEGHCPFPVTLQSIQR